MLRKRRYCVSVADSPPYLKTFYFILLTHYGHTGSYVPGMYVSDKDTTVFFLCQCFLGILKSCKFFYFRIMLKVYNYIEMIRNSRASDREISALTLLGC